VRDQSRFECLTDGDLNHVSGGMKCDTAIGMSKIYLTMSDLYLQMGMSAQSAGYSGQALGLLQGACTKPT
jgi:hypothetical protein